MPELHNDGSTAACLFHGSGHTWEDVCGTAHHFRTLTTPVHTWRWVVQVLVGCVLQPNCPYLVPHIPQLLTSYVSQRQQPYQTLRLHVVRVPPLCSF
jgi:hypothetical protein